MARRSPLAFATLILTLTCIVLAPALASTFELQAAVTRHMFDDGRSKTRYSVEERRQLAQSFLDYWTSFDNRIPRLSPAEGEWIKQELNSGSSDRRSALFNRREYGIWTLQHHAPDCRKAYTELIPNIGGNPKLEALRWARSVGCYTDRRLGEDLRLAGLTRNDRVDGPFVMQMFVIWQNAILGGVLGSVLDEPNFR
jgi:hypothetical protein